MVIDGGSLRVGVVEVVVLFSTATIKNPPTTVCVYVATLESYLSGGHYYVAGGQGGKGGARTMAGGNTRRKRE